MANDILVPFLGALQASIAVLLTIFAGVIAAQFRLLSEQSSKAISRFCVRICLPCLLIVNVGSQLSLETGSRFVPIIVWAITYNVLSMLLGLAITKMFKTPSWTTPAIAFNNTTSLPLLLVSSLAATGLLDSLDPSPDVVQRAKSYFLINAMVGNSLTFALGPKLLNGQEEDAPDNPEKEEYEEVEEEENEADVPRQIEAQREEAEDINEDTSLLPGRVARHGTRAHYRGYLHGWRYWRELPSWAQMALDFLYQFVNPPVIGAALGAFFGLIPSLHTLMFEDQENGGYLNAWLTSALRNVGDLFAALQVIIVGVKLSRALLRMKKGEESGHVPWLPLVIITTIRFIMWPAISIGVVYLLATKTNVLPADPLMWFVMMLMPGGPPGMKLTALADVNGSDADEKMGIAKFLTISYSISPLLSFSVVASLKASQAAVGK
ncbi:hypothetical protein D0862_05910 [Hortaea werneckii]|uniref:Transporter n=1 Tax=Hortaea werneckii TaxID=91943 RepID=A0A3M7GNL1_HORWE|nr:hypothetical protein D0862_05910 [Hortaea werneckii]